MISNYQDKHAFWHHKPCINGEPRSNNRFIYSAYAKYLAPDQEWSPSKRSEQVIASREMPPIPLKIHRLPGKLTPPISKDEIIGLISLGYISSYDLEESHWNFCNLPEYKPRPLSIGRVFRAVKGLWSLRKGHRNDFWQNKREEVYCLAFRLLPQYRYYVKEYCGEKPNLWESFNFYINFIFTLTKGKNYSKMLLWLMCEDMDHWTKRFINRDKLVREEFEKDHDFIRNLDES